MRSMRLLGEDGDPDDLESATSQNSAVFESPLAVHAMNVVEFQEAVHDERKAGP